MIKNADLPAMPNDTDPQTFGLIHKSGDMSLLLKHNTGLTKREMFAMAAMQGLASSASDYSRFYEMAKDAVAIADALLAELERTKDD